MQDFARHLAGDAPLAEWDRSCVWHPFTPMQAWQSENAPVIVRGQGFHLFDAAGNCWLDGISSLWCNVHGHCVPELDQAIREQLDKVAHTTLLGLGSEPSIRLARALLDRAPTGLSRVFYSDSGASTVEVALKMAYQFQRQKPGGDDRRRLFLSIGNAYHGDTLGTVSVGGIDLFHRCYRDLLFPGITVPSPVALRVPQGHTSDSWLQYCFDEVERQIRLRCDELVAVVMEPLVQGAAGILVHPEGYLRHIRQLCDRHNVLLIADEVAVGFGRTGTLFACEQEQVSPDILCLAKGITGGYLPIGTTLVTEQIYEAFLGEPWEGRTFYHGHTYTGNALGCAVGLKSLQLFEERNLLANVAQCSEVLSERLAVLEGHPHVAEVRQRGVMVGIELVQDRDGLRPFPVEQRVGHQVTLEARRQGVIIRPLGDVVVLMPAPGMPADTVHQLCDVALQSIEAVTHRIRNGQGTES